jgi:hypothetical protein
LNTADGPAANRLTPPGVVATTTLGGQYVVGVESREQ